MAESLSEKFAWNLLPPLIDKAGNRRVVIAGPCSAESRDQVLATARHLASEGILYFRAGLWKPRTRPGSFEGVGSRGLPWLTEAARKFGVRPITEVATPGHLKSALRAGVRDFWIGARTSANPFAVQEIADALAELPASQRDSVSVLVKNPVTPDIELWIGGLQRIHKAGIRRLGAVHRGFGVYGKSRYRNEPHWAIPIELRRRVPGLAIYCDPSHIAGRRELVGEVSQKAMDLDFDGLMVETHVNPAGALSDASQQLTPQETAALAKSAWIRKPTSGVLSDLEGLRADIDTIDDELIHLLSRRMEVSRQIGVLKRRRGLAVIQPDRYRDLMERRVAQGVAAGLAPDFTARILAAIHEESVNQQINRK